MMVKNSITGNVDAYQWSSANNEWINVGQVVDAVGSGRKQLYEGKEYDYVFDVDVSEGMPALKLPYNVTREQFFLSLPLAGKETLIPFLLGRKSLRGSTAILTEERSTQQLRRRSRQIY